MTTLRVNIANQSDAKKLASFLRTLGYVESVSVEKPIKSVRQLSDTDWILPGSPATQAEIDQLLDEMDKDSDEGITTQQLKKEIAQWSKGIYK